MSDKNKSGEFYIQPEKTQFKDVLWNSETKQFLFRTGESWSNHDIFDKFIVDG